MSRRTGIAGNQMKIGDHLQAWREGRLVEGPSTLQPPASSLGAPKSAFISLLLLLAGYSIDLLATESGILRLSLSQCSSLDSLTARGGRFLVEGRKREGVGIRARGTG